MGNSPGFKSSNAGIVLGDANVAFCSLDGTSTVDAFGISNGNTLQRPTTPKAGMLRWNTDSGQFEFFNGAFWDTFGGAAVSLTGPAWSNASCGSQITYYGRVHMRMLNIIRIPLGACICAA
jgi:hypothetical protein